MEIISQLPTTNSATIAANVLKKNGLVIFPTDTVYGIAANATSQQAVAKLLKFKGHRQHKPISIAVRDQAMAQQYAYLNETAKKLYSNYLPGPLTIISDLLPSPRSTDKLSPGITSVDSTIGIRIIPHPFVGELFNLISFPITATSGNISNGPNPRSLSQWQQATPSNKQALIDLFIDAGPLPYAQPSTIINTTKESTKVIRQGDLMPLNTSLSSENKNYLSQSPEETQNIAADILNQIIIKSKITSPQSIIIFLQGEMGVGKTVFTKGIGQALNLNVPLRSPTYSLIKEYPLNHSRFNHLIHIDAWRITSTEEFDDLRLETYLNKPNLIVIEWPQRLKQIVPKLSLISQLFLINITHHHQNQRQITINH